MAAVNGLVGISTSSEVSCGTSVNTGTHIRPMGRLSRVGRRNALIPSGALLVPILDPALPGSMSIQTASSFTSSRVLVTASDPLTIYMRSIGFDYQAVPRIARFTLRKFAAASGGSALSSVVLDAVQNTGASLESAGMDVSPGQWINLTLYGETDATFGGTLELRSMTGGNGVFSRINATIMVFEGGFLGGD
jgi:hypothetical protein